VRSVIDIQADLVAAYSSRRSAMQASEYGLETGQGKQSVKRDLPGLNKTIRNLEAELSEATGESGVFAMGFDRGSL